jgi:hypothetical protein
MGFEALDALVRMGNDAGIIHERTISYRDNKIID